VKEFFELNRPIVLFLYGQTFFVMGLAIFLQSRRYSRLQLARDLRWLAAFGVLHGFHEWGMVFIPIQSTYLPIPYTSLLQTLQVILLAASYTCLSLFGAAALVERWRAGRRVILSLGVTWIILFGVALQLSPDQKTWLLFSSAWARYLLGFPGSLLAAFGLRYHAGTGAISIGGTTIKNTLHVTSYTLAVYAFLGGLLVAPVALFPASILNSTLIEDPIGIPVEVYRSIAGMIMAVSIIRALEVFDIEEDRLIESMEVEHIRAAERDRIGQEIHDGAMQGVYSISLILESMQPHVAAYKKAADRLEQARRVLEDVIADLRRYMVSLRVQAPEAPLAECLENLANNPRFSSLVDIVLKLDIEPELSPGQAGNLLAITQEALSNAVRHARASRVTITLSKEQEVSVLRIEDDGQGFDEKQTPSHFGLRAMYDQAHLMGTSLTLHSQPGSGTVIELVLPESRSS
jgi:signal transduction histidine kinase